MSLQFLKTLTIHGLLNLKEPGLFIFYPTGFELILGNINAGNTITLAF
jgi:hypothetical protein